MIEYGSLLEGTPFKEQLVSSGFVSQVGETQKLMVLNSAPEKIIRVGWFAIQEIGDPTYNYYTENRNVLKRLRDHYGIAVPEFSLVIGAYQGKPRFYTVSERVHGPRLSEKVYSPQEVESARDKLEHFYSGLVRYFRDLYTNGGWYIADLVEAGNWSGTAQYVFGKTRGDSDERIYFVDLGPCLEWHARSGDLRPFDFQLPKLFGMITEIESKLGSRLQNARENFSEFLDSMSERHKSLDSVRDLKRKVDSR